jgi:nucleotide-binding universal stress UspA family protein
MEGEAPGIYAASVADPPSTEHPVVVCWGGDDSAPAVHLGAALAQALGAPLELAAAYLYAPVTLSSRILPPAETEARFAAARAGLARARHLAAPLVPRERVLPADRVPPSLGDLAREVDACLLVVGQDLDGHVTRDVLQHAPCPVAVAPAAETTGVPRNIGVAYDGSPAARHALVAARHLALATEGTVTLLCVGERASRQAANLVSMPRLLALDGEPGPSLVGAAATLDLLVCGSRGHGRLASSLLGSVSSALVAAAPCPVLVVGPSAAPTDAAPLGVSTAASR